MFGFLKRRKKRINPDVPKSKPYQLKNDVNRQHLDSWTATNIAMSGVQGQEKPSSKEDKSVGSHESVDYSPSSAEKHTSYDTSYDNGSTSYSDSSGSSYDGGSFGGGE